jgi:predicted SAM-dependent methyltransferase
MQPMHEAMVRTGTDELTALPRELNLGCGTRRREGWLNVDRVARVLPDLVWDLDQYPYPLATSHFRWIFAGDVVEHLRNIPDFMQEVHRLLEAGGCVEITTPHFSCANSYTDPTHRHHLGYFSGSSGNRVGDSERF